MIQDYLKKLQELQSKTYGTKVQMSIQTHMDPDDGQAWLTTTIYHRRWLDEEDENPNLYLNEAFYDDPDDTQDEKDDKHWKTFAKVVSFVNNLLSI